MKAGVVALLGGAALLLYALVALRARERITAGMRFSVRGSGERSGEIYPLVAVADQDDARGTVDAVFLDAQGDTQPTTVPLSAIVSVGYD